MAWRGRRPQLCRTINRHPLDRRLRMTLTTSAPHRPRRTLSAVVESLTRGDDPTLRVSEMVEAFGERAFGALILLLAMMSLFPWPPGGKAVFSAPIILLSLELVIRRDTVWLPRWVLNASVSRATYAKLIARPFSAPGWLRRWVLTRRFNIGTGPRRHRYVASDWFRRLVRRRPRGMSFVSLLRKIERLSKPRLPMLTGEIADVIVGVICVLLAVMLALPVPLGDMLPAVTLAIFGLALTQRDGLAILAGAAGTIVCGIYLVLIWAAVVAIVQGVVGWVGGWF